MCSGNMVKNVKTYKTWKKQRQMTRISAGRSES
jgi:hypothetical protein